MVDYSEARPAAAWVDAAAYADGVDPTSIRSAGRALKLARAVQNLNAM